MNIHLRELELVTNTTPAPGRQGTAITVGRSGSGGSWTLEADGRQFEAKRAASCLLEPEIGDEVWFVAQGERSFVLAVLERAEAAGVATLSVNGDAALRVNGQLDVHASAGVELRSDAQVGITGAEVRVQAKLARMVFDEGTAVLRSMFSHVTNSTFVGKVIETVADRVVQSSKTSLRTVAELDQVQAGVIDYRASDAAHVAADQVLINGGQIAKVEAGQIHLG
ncbi:hypothetical protein DB30_03379 [Enhygromyxa salina]|uniref:DUF3540 domain-containing protein n=1 Tax=Enhygromyxa salina TaxID=215803 RepID=A0A0C2DC82_9BACT|nr:DUF3540 domain-containing protein [Enhygromyxa salina]KIG17322.1 hypothetical protein DB30_03379 [Enhygromyxa salina]